MTECSRKYIEKAKVQLDKMEDGLPPDLLEVIRELSECFSHAATKMRVVERL